MNTANQSFINSLIRGAQEAMKTFGVPASVTIAQAILESAWGKSALTRTANNLFGIKADASWHGDKVNMPTTEYVHGNPVKVNAYFRKYNSLAESIQDHARFLKENHRYASAFECSSGIEFSSAIAKCGYATDTHYAKLLISLINQYDLDQYDHVM